MAVLLNAILYKVCILRIIMLLIVMYNAPNVVFVALSLSILKLSIHYSLGVDQALFLELKESCNNLSQKIHRFLLSFLVLPLLV